MEGAAYLLFLLTMFSSVFGIQSKEMETYGSTPQVIESQVEVEDEEIAKLQISLVGDLLMDGSIRGYLDKHGQDYPWQMVKTYFQNDHISIGNLETSITNKGSKWPNKQFNFRSDPSNLKAMEVAGMDILALANNHILDYGYDGLLDTIKHIDSTGIKRVGAGKNKEDAMKAVILERQGIKIGVLSASRVVPDVKWYAGEKSPGLVGAYDGHIDGLLKEIEKTKKQVDLLILSIHWGIEKNPQPKDKDILLAKRLIDGGVDIIMGHHPHVLQGIEIYKGKPIFYSLGNFVFGSQGELTTNTMIAQVNLIDGKMDNIEIIPLNIEGARPVPVNQETRKIKIDYLNKLSKGFGTSINKDGIIKIETN